MYKNQLEYFKAIRNDILQSIKELEIELISVQDLESVWYKVKQRLDNANKELSEIDSRISSLLVNEPVRDYLKKHYTLWFDFYEKLKEDGLQPDTKIVIVPAGSRHYNLHKQSSFDVFAPIEELSTLFDYETVTLDTQLIEVQESHVNTEYKTFTYGFNGDKSIIVVQSLG